MKKLLFVMVVGGSLLWVGLNSITELLDRPEVHKSYSTGKCVKVINYKKNDNYSCENLPSRYSHVWVE